MRLAALALALVVVLAACGGSSSVPGTGGAGEAQRSSAEAERLCRRAADSYNGTVAAAFAMTVEDVKTAMPVATPGGADNYPDGWELLDGDTAAAKCYIDADIAKAPPPAPDGTARQSFDRALLYAAPGVNAALHAAGYRKNLTPEPPVDNDEQGTRPACDLVPEAQRAECRGGIAVSDGPAGPQSGREHSVSLSLFHCGIYPVTVEGRLWEADRSDLLLDATNAPASWAGTGTAVVSGERMTYTDDGGLVVPFVPDDGVPPPACL